MTYLDIDREPAKHWNKIKQYALNHSAVCLGLEIRFQEEKGDQEKLSQIHLQGIFAQKQSYGSPFKKVLEEIRRCFFKDIL